MFLSCAVGTGRSLAFWLKKYTRTTTITAVHTFQSEMSGKQRNQVYASYLSIEEVRSKLETGELLRGTIRVNTQNKGQAFVSVKGICSDVYIDGEVSRNRAVHGDVVVLKLSELKDWASVRDPSSPSSSSSSSSTTDPSHYSDVQVRLWQPKLGLLSPTHIETRGHVDNDNGELSERVNNINNCINTSHLQPKGHVVHILENRHQASHIGALKVHNENQLIAGQTLPESQSYVFFQPKDTRYPTMMIPRLQLPDAFTRDPCIRIRDIYVADLDENWSVYSKYPVGINVRSLGEMGDIATETKALLIQNNVDHGQFTDEHLSCLQSILGEHGENWIIPLEEVTKRRDLRSYRIFTIDPPTAKDLDDALHITQLDNGEFELGVHIADVSYFLKQDDALDAEAMQRATSVYLVQKVIPMLPSVLCEQLCSLNPNVDRLAFSCIWKMRSDGSIVNEPPWFGKTIIRSCSKLDYPTAQRMIDGIIPSSGEAFALSDEAFYEDMPEEIWEKARFPIGHRPMDVARDVCLLHDVAMARREKRLSSGALVITNPKLTFRLDENGNPCQFGTYLIRDSNRLVEEYMLLANYFVAEELIRKVDNAAFLRSHAPPDPKKLDELKDITEKIGVHIDASTAQSLQESLCVIAKTADISTQRIISALLAKPMKPASYMVANRVEAANWRHYALSIPYYTHFTSPIRRYADVVVHRLLDMSIQGDDYDTIALADKLAPISEHCNEMKLASKAAQERSDRVYWSIYLRQNPCEEEAVVTSVGQTTFTVFILKYGFESKLFVDEMKYVESTCDREAKTISLTNRPFQGRTIQTFHTMDISILTKVKIHLSTREKPPLDLYVQLIGPV